ncbi:hypothetical protein VitviT2T_016623 [Vitis vinifera]|uniref:Protein kinase domain-containing protein n=2 Tax=Vitis vinifera TaxID=29760 RepID=A0ABY9CR46_VITVI|nr:hypothetical protein VitviT2T_016623 [Vitis vinifera]
MITIVAIFQHFMNCLCFVHHEAVGKDLKVLLTFLVLLVFQCRINLIFFPSLFSDQRMRRLLLVIIIPVVSVIFLTLVSFCYLLWRKYNPGGTILSQTIIKKCMRLHLAANDRVQNANGLQLDINEDHELPLLNFSWISTATKNFSFANRLGEGGFGPVFKGNIGGHEFAVKRLSSTSGQGLEEFKNEVQLISKLQHRNLVRLLGCCIHQEEKMLIYEYMPNKSLDSFLFDPIQKKQLDWAKCFHIIEGIAQGLLYLHKYSRLRIIHRDLKTSNILLDSYMNPKISDFGLARIFGENESKAKTKRVVGTYGYMSPEYAVHGLFSTKSGVFSFGVIMLEIVSGRRNVAFSQSECTLNLLGHAWDLWKDGRSMELMDPTLAISCSMSELTLCVQVGLLCIQESAEDRPTMSDVVSILSNERAILPTPRQPAFCTLISVQGTDSQMEEPKCSLNYVTLSVAEAR